MAEPVKVRKLTDQEGQQLQRIVRRGSTSTVRHRSGNLHSLVDSQTARLPPPSPRSGDPHRARGIAPLLARRGVTFQRSKTWKESTEPMA